MTKPIEIIQTTAAYKAIEEFYGTKRALRSGIPLINHIDEGLYILNSLNADLKTMEAYCLHPIFQSDTQIRLPETYELAKTMDPQVIMLVMEYRKCANSYLCRLHTDSWTADMLRDKVGLLMPQVRYMLIADKTQNQKDFYRFHQGVHERSKQLEHYFATWMSYLCSKGCIKEDV